MLASQHGFILSFHLETRGTDSRQAQNLPDEIALECYDDRLDPFISRTEFGEFIERLKNSGGLNAKVKILMWVVMVAIGVTAAVLAAGHGQIQSLLGEWAPPLFAGLAITMLICSFWVPAKIEEYSSERD